MSPEPSLRIRLLIAGLVGLIAGVGVCWLTHQLTQAHLARLKK